MNHSGTSPAAALRALWARVADPPVFADPVESRRAANLHAILLVVLAVYSAALLIGVPFVFVRKLEGGAITLVILAAAAVSWYCMRRGAVRLGSHLIAWTLWIFASVVVLLSAQVYNAAMFIAPVFVVAVLFGPWFAAASAVAGIAATLFGNYAGAFGMHLPRIFPAPPYSQSFVFGMQLALAMSAFYIILRRLDRARRDSEQRLTLALEAEEALQFRHRLDALILRVSSRFLLARQDETGAVDETLADVGRFVAADRCYVSLLDETGDTYSLASEWCAEGIPSKRAVRQRLPTASLWKGIERDEIAYVTVSELPPESEALRRVLEAAGIQSSLRVSIRIEGRLLGVLGLDSVRGEKRWPDDVAVLLRVVADILGSSLGRERAQAEIRWLNAELGERVRERTLQLEAINQELEAFSYSVSHDLRGPLRRIEGFSRILLMSHTDRLDEQGQELLARVRNSIQHMGRLIDDLLKLGRVNQQTFVRGEIDLSAMARDVLASLASGEPERYVECVVADGLAVNADRGLMQVALENLIGNAWKFTGNEPRARIEVGAGEVAGETVYHVCDNGTGFDMAYADNLFGAFQRLHTPGEFEGSGIGLATVRRIMTRHGGRVWADSVPGKGSAFYFTVGTDDFPTA